MAAPSDEEPQIVFWRHVYRPFVNFGFRDDGSPYIYYYGDESRRRTDQDQLIPIDRDRLVPTDRLAPTDDFFDYTGSSSSTVRRLPPGVVEIYTDSLGFTHTYLVK